MPRAAGTTMLVVSLLLMGQDVAGQGSAAPTPACALLSAAEVREITGRTGYMDELDGDALGEGLGGGSSCMYDSPAFARATGTDPAPMIGLVLIPGKDWTRRRQTVQLHERCRREAVDGLGDLAFFELCEQEGARKRTSPLYIKVGDNDLVVQMDIESDRTEADVRPTVLALARAAVGKLR